MAVVWQLGLIALLALASMVLLVWVVAVRRLMHMRWKAALSNPMLRDAIPAELRAVLDQPAAELTQLGFAYRSSGAIRQMVVTPDDAPNFYDLYQHCDGHTFALVAPSPTPEPHQPCQLQLVTCLQDGSNWLTLNRSSHLAPVDMPGWHVVDDYLPQWNQAWQRHLQRVHAATVPLCTDAQEAERRLHKSFEDLLPHMRQQGMLVRAEKGNTGNNGGLFRLTLPASTRMARRVLIGQLRAAWTAAQNPASPAVLSNADNAHATDLQEAQARSRDADLRAFQNQLAATRTAPATASRKATTFVATGLLFLLVGGLLFSWTLVPIVLAVVALHEGGHYLAMRLTGFRNVSVFFVPGLGGLATGEKATATPLEKLFVYLAGPVPGIALAGVAFWASAAGYWSGPSWLREFLIVSFVINYLNLLPLTPLDGGRVLDILVFAHYPRLRFGFAVLGCAALFGLGMLLDDTVLRVIAVLVALGLPHHWRRMQLDRAVPREGNAALDEPEALQRIFGALQRPQFQAWSFAKRSTAAQGLLPDLLARRANRWEAAVGVVVYAACLLGPIGAALVAMPHLGAVVTALAPMATIPPDDVDPEPARAPGPDPIDWQARLAQDTVGLTPDALLEARLGAGAQAADSNDLEGAERQYQAAWALAQALPARDPRRTDVLQGLASVAADEAQRRAHLQQIVAELTQPTGSERTRLAEAKEALAYGDVGTAERVALLEDALDLRLGNTPPETDHALSNTRLSLAQALDAQGDTAGAQAQLLARLDALPLADAQDRSRRALDQRVMRVLATVDLAWFWIAHGRAAEAEKRMAETLGRMPAKVTSSWIHPRQEALEVQVWATLLSNNATGDLAPQWEAYEAARRAGFGGRQKLLFHEVDRALVAQALNDASMASDAKRGIAESMAARSRPGTALCKPLPDSVLPQWRAPQQKARQQVLVESGLCPKGA